MTRCRSTGDTRASIVDAKKVLRLDFPRSLVTEYWLEPFPGARPVVPLLLVLCPYDAFGRPLGGTQLHGALISVADAPGRKYLFRGRRKTKADSIPFVIERDRASSVACREFGPEADQPKSMRAHDLRWSPSPASTYKDEIPNLIRAHKSAPSIKGF